MVEGDRGGELREKGAWNPFREGMYWDSDRAFPNLN